MATKVPEHRENFKKIREDIDKVQNLRQLAAQVKKLTIEVARLKRYIKGSR